MHATSLIHTNMDTYTHRQPAVCLLIPSSASGPSDSEGLAAPDGVVLWAAVEQWFSPGGAGSELVRAASAASAGRSRWFFLLSSFLWLCSLCRDFLWQAGALLEPSGCGVEAADEEEEEEEEEVGGAAAAAAGRRLDEVVDDDDDDDAGICCTGGSGTSLSEPSMEMRPSLSEKGSASESSSASDWGEWGTSRTEDS